MSCHSEVPQVDPHLSLTYLAIASNGIWPDLVFICVEESVLKLSQVSEEGAVFELSALFLFL